MHTSAAVFHTVRALLIGVLLLTNSEPPGGQPAAQGQPAGRGQSATLLTDGRWLFIGGEGTESYAALWDPVSGSTVPTTAPVVRPRAWHSATVLADGTVLIAGGRTPDGRILSAPERFDPVSATFQPVAASTLAARAFHTATLLTDGRVLLAGGLSVANQSVAETEVWNPATETSVAVGRLHVPRSRHTATLGADGDVWIRAGVNENGGVPEIERFDPVTGEFTPASAIGPSQEAPFVAAVFPAHGSEDVPIETTITVRFSEPIDIDSLPEGVRLIGPQGALNGRPVLAESGRLLFLHPEVHLAPATTYRIELTGLRDTRGDHVQSMASSFRTRAVGDSSRIAEPDTDWSPDLTSSVSWETGRPDSPWRTLPPLEAPGGVTALTGQVLDVAGSPLPRVVVQLGDREAVTDDSGRFLLSPVLKGRGILRVHAHAVGRVARNHGMYDIQVDVAERRTNLLPFTIWLSRIDEASAVPLNPAVVQRVTTPRMRGVEVRIPAGVILRSDNGTRLDRLTMTPLPVDRAPVPLPSGQRPIALFTVQTHGARVERTSSTGDEGVRIVYPNTLSLPAGTRVDLWTYDAAGRGWVVYGQGAVSPDGTRVEPDRGVRLHRVQCLQLASLAGYPGTGPAAGGGPGIGDPVDAATGLFVMDKTDLALPDVLPLVLTRTYRQNDTVSRAFGIGMTHGYDLALAGPASDTSADLILPDGGRIHYVRTSSGTGHLTAVMEHTATPTAFYKSVVAWNTTRSGYDLTAQDGTVYEFGGTSNGTRLVGVRDRVGNRLVIERSGVKVVRVVAPHGRVLEFTSDASNRVTSVSDTIGRTVIYTYDASGRLWKVTDVAGGVTEYTYDAAHRMLTIKDPRGIVYLTNEYDANGRVYKQTMADGGVFEFAYTLDGSNQVTQTDVTYPRGQVRRVTFNSAGYALTDTFALGTSAQQTTTYERETGTQFLLATVDPLNRRTTFSYDGDGHVTTVTALAGTAGAVTTSYTYEPTFGLVSGVTDPLSRTTSFAYDSVGRLTSVTDPLMHQTTFAYNGAGLPVSTTDALNHTTQFEYDGADLVSVTSPLGRRTTSFVDAAGRVLSVTDPLGRRSRFEYSALNKVTRIIDPLIGETSFTHDPNGNVLTVTDARNKTTTWTFDNMDRVATRTDPLSRVETFGYDLHGNLTSWTDRKGQVTTYQYDSLDRQILVGFGTTGTPPAYASTITTTYDAGDRPTQIVDSAAGTIAPTYDLFGRLTQEVTPEGTINYTYDAANRPATMQVAGQSSVTYTYDNANRLTGITQGTASVSIAYDNADRRTSLTLPNGIVVEYGYDDDSQLNGLTYKLGTTTLGDLSYSYDAIGQRIAVGGTWARSNLPPLLTSATYDDANQIATWAGTSFTYDQNGNLTSDGVRTYAWNARNELASLTGPVNGSFGYDALGRRRSKMIGGSTTQFLYDGLNPVQELSGGTPTANVLAGLGIDEFFTRTDAAGTRHYLSDALGSTVALANGAGAISTSYTYEAFGATTATGGSTTNAMGFTAREADGTGLYFYRARYYDPRLQRFIGEDPLGFEAGDPNLHAYVSNAPTILVDPTGEVAWAAPVIGCLIGGGGSAVGDMMAGRKINWGGAAAGCAWGAFGGWAGGWAGGAAGRAAAAAWGRGRGAASTAAGMMRGGTTVYRSVNAAGDVQYVGITNNVARRAAEHFRDRGMHIETLVDRLSRSDGRAVEQALIEIHGLMRNGGTLLNRINSIAPSNPTYAAQLRRGYALLQSIGYRYP